MLTIYKASAGSGKTFTLALKYITLLLGVRRDDGSYVLNHRRYVRRPGARRHSRILAVTFTNKATAEMKDRIVSELYNLTALPPEGARDSDFAPLLTKALGCSREELAEAASAAFRQLLDDYSNFNVSTIDTFFQTVLRGFAREIERQGDYRLEIKPQAVISQAMGMLFDELNIYHTEERMGRVARWLSEMAGGRRQEGFDFNPFNRKSSMFKEIFKSVESTFKEEFMSVQGDIAAYMADSSRLDEFEKWLDKAVAALREDIVRDLKALLPGVKEGLTKDCDKYLDSIVTSDGDFKVLLAKLEGSKPPKYGISLLAGSPEGVYLKSAAGRERRAGELGRYFTEAVKKARTGMRYTMMRRSTLTLWALTFIHEFIDRYRRENNLILLADTNVLLDSIISESDTPFIYEKVGVELENFLIDEFQDTSGLQWNNLRPLLANSLASDHDSLIIGDVKQSIYRWRGGDPDLLDKDVATRDFPAPLSTVKGDAEGENTNYRSAHLLVKFNNTLFHTISSQRDIAGYGGIAQKPAAKNAHLDARVEILDMQGDLDRLKSTLPPDAVTETGTRLDGMDARQLSLALMARRILEQHAAGYAFRDIAVLCRTGNDTVEVADFLRNHYPSVKIVSEEGLLLSRSPAVKKIVSMLEIIDKSLFDTPSAEAPAPLVEDERELRMRRRIESLRRRERLADTFNFYIAEGVEVSEALRLALEAVNSGAPDNRVDNDIEAIRRMAPSSLGALIEAIIDLKIPHDQRRREIAYITAFIDMATRFAENFTPSVHAFLSHWNEASAHLTVATGDNLDAVNIMTVHKSKGLEWDCVHIPLMNWRLSPRYGKEWLDPSADPSLPAHLLPPLVYMRPDSYMAAEDSPYRPYFLELEARGMADNLNVAYVAFTRAGRELDVHMLPPLKPEAGAVYMPQAITEAVAAADAADKDIYIPLAPMNDADGNIAAGTPTSPEEDKKKKGGTAVLPPPRFSVCFNNLNSRFTQVRDITTLDEPADDPDIGNEAPREIVDTPEPPFMRRMEEAARKGMLMHSVLSQMYRIDDLDRAVALHRRQISPAEARECRLALEEAFSKAPAEVARWFEPDAKRVLNEQSFYDPSADETRRVDRIVLGPDGDVDVVDYKFTSRPRESHVTQVKLYIANLSEIYPGRCVTGWLWYPMLGIVKKVSR